MKYEGLYKKIEERIAECAERYEKDKGDPYRSHVIAAEKETLEALYERVRKEEPSAALKAALKNRLCELEEAKDREDAAPSFSWYGEHYHYLVLDGGCNAYRCMIELLQEENV